jgi:hypothetical protein
MISMADIGSISKAASGGFAGGATGASKGSYYPKKSSSQPGKKRKWHNRNKAKVNY